MLAIWFAQTTDYRLDTSLLLQLTRTLRYVCVGDDVVGEFENPWICNWLWIKLVDRIRSFLLLLLLYIGGWVKNSDEAHEPGLYKCTIKLDNLCFYVMFVFFSCHIAYFFSYQFVFWCFLKIDTFFLQFM